MESNVEMHDCTPRMEISWKLPSHATARKMRGFCNVLCTVITVEIANTWLAQHLSPAG